MCVAHIVVLTLALDLARLYRLYSPYPADLEPIGKIFHDHVSQAGIAIVDQAQKSTGADQGNHSLVRNLIDLHERYNSIVRDCLGNNSVFQKSLKAVRSPTPVVAWKLFMLLTVLSFVFVGRPLSSLSTRTTGFPSCWPSL